MIPTFAIAHPVVFALILAALLTGFGLFLDKVTNEVPRL